MPRHHRPRPEAAPATGAPVPPPGAFVLRRDPGEELRAWQALQRQIWRLRLLGVLFVGLLVWMIVSSVRNADPGWIVWMVIIGGLAAIMTYALRKTGTWARAEGGLRDLELWIAPEGVTYVSVSGVFHAPWTAVRGMYIGDYFGSLPHQKRGVPSLIVQVEGWGGPLADRAEDGTLCVLAMPLAGLDADRPTIRRAVYEISGGGVTVGAY